MKKEKNNKRNSGKTKPKKKKMKLWKKILLIILLVLAVALGVFAYKVQKNGGGLSGIVATAVGHDMTKKENIEELRCLILGISTDQDGVNLTDTIMVASYNPKTQKATLLSIPRDTYTGKNSAKATAYEKINALYGRKNRADETLKAVNEITGLDIKYYAVIRTKGLIDLVDAIGGVTYNVPIDMVYDDDGQDLHINLKKGEQKLDGDKAEQLVRFRHSNPDKYGRVTSYPPEWGDNDLGRMRTQREFIMQTIKQTMKIENIFKIGQILDVAKENLETNMDFEVLKDYIPYAVEFDTSNLLTETLPGDVPDYRQTNNVSVFVYNKKETKNLINKLFLNRDKTEDELEDEGSTITKKSETKIEVLNGSGETSNLEKVVKELKGAGYKVSKQGTTNTTSKTVIVKDKDVSSTITEGLEEVLGIGVVQKSETTGGSVNVTIIIGKDYEG